MLTSVLEISLMSCVCVCVCVCVSVSVCVCVCLDNTKEQGVVVFVFSRDHGTGLEKPTPPFSSQHKQPTCKSRFLQQLLRSGHRTGGPFWSAARRSL